MSVQRPHDGTCELTVQPTVSTLHIPVSHAFIPFQQFSLSDPTGLRNPADDNNNKTAVPVVSVVAAVSGLCPALPVVSMQQQAQLPQAVVAPTIIPTVVTPMAVQTANGLAPTTTMTMSNTLNINSHLSVPTAQQHQQQALNNAGISLSSQTTGITSSNNTTTVNNNNNNNTISAPLNMASNTQQACAPVTTGAIKPNSNNNSNTISTATNTTIGSNNNITTTPNKPNNNNNNGGSSTSKQSSTATTSSSSQSSNTEQTDDLVKPVYRDGELVLEVECGQNKAILFLSKLCQGSKGPCISFQSSWLTPNEFQFVSGRETAKDWKRSIRHHGKSLKLLLAKGILSVHPTMCDCDGCRQGATLTRKGEKRRIPNGERKPRKPSNNPTNGGSEAHVTGGFRPLGPATMAAHLVSPGGAPVKPDVKRSAGDKPKTAESTPQSPLRESSLNLPKAGLVTKSGVLARPDSLNAPMDVSGAAKASSSSATSAPSSPAASSTTPNSTATTPQVTSSSAPTTPSKAPTFSPIAATTPTSSSRLLSATLATLASSNPFLARVPAVSEPMVAPPSSAPSEATSAPTTPLTAKAVLVPVQPPASEQQVSPLQSPNLPGSKLAQTPSASSSSCDALTTPAASLSADEDDNNSNAAQGEDKTCEVMSENESEPTSEDESDEEEDHSDTCSKTSEVRVSEQVDEGHMETLDNQSIAAPEQASPIAQSIPQECVKPTDSSQNVQKDTTQMEIAEPKPAIQDSTEIPVTIDTTKDNHPAMQSSANVSTLSSSPPSSLGTSTTATSTTRLAVAAITGTCGQPLSVSVSSNVKSEHIWVPPTLSPAHDMHHLHQPHYNSSSNNNNSDSSSSRVKSPPPSLKSPSHKSVNVDNTDHHHQQRQHQHPHHRRDIPTFAASVPDNDLRHEMSRKFPSEMPKSETENSKNLGQLTVKTELGSTGNPKSREFQSIERHLNSSSHSNGTSSSHTQGSHSLEREGVRKEYMDAKPFQPGPVPSGDRHLREREERHRQRMREERNRKDREREERNRKEREREAERREEKDAERKRQEEKERRDLAKAQAESAAVKERLSATPVTPAMDPSRRPPGGVADAAAFSDYMRVLAAGHGHTFLPSAPSYMPSLFPIRPQEPTALPSHLLHPMSAAYGPQLGSLPKDPMLYQSTAGAMSPYASPAYGPLHPLLQRAQLAAAQPSLLDYQRSLAASYPWPTPYPYLLQDMAAASSSSSSAAAAAAAVGAKRHAAEMEAALDLNAKRMRLEGRPLEYTSPWDYFAAAAAASQQPRHPMTPALPCGMESASMDKTAEYLRKRYMEYGPQTAAYLSALPEYARPMYHCACADHRDEDIRMWNVEDVCKFLNSLDGCGVYAEHFREQRVDGRILALLTTDHLVKTLGMKLGPAVLLSEAVAKKLQDISKMSSCEACRSIALSQPVHPMALPL